jgi:hypothetical protein
MMKQVSTVGERCDLLLAKTEAHTATCRIMAVHRRCVLSQVGLLQPLGGARALAVSRDRLALAPPPRI